MPNTTAKTDLIVYKYAHASAKTCRHVIVTLRIKKGTRVNIPRAVNSSTSMRAQRKCRAALATVIAIHRYRQGGIKGAKLKTAVSQWDNAFTYHIGKPVRPTKAFSRRTEICASGIHFYHSLNDALRHGCVI